MIVISFEEFKKIFQCYFNSHDNATVHSGDLFDIKSMRILLKVTNVMIAKYKSKTS